MRICFLIHAITSGGAERTISYLCNNFVNRDNTIVDLVQYDVPHFFYDIDKRVNCINLTKGEPGKSKLSRVNALLKKMSSFRKYCKEYSPDVIVCMMHMTKLIALRKPKNIPIILSERNNPAVALSRMDNMFRKRFYNTADGIVFQTKRAKQYYVENILKDNKGIVIQNAVGNTLAYEIDATSTEKEKKIVAVGRLNEQKNYKLLIEAFAKVLEKHDDYVLKIYGEGDQREELNRIVVEHKLDDKIFFEGAHKNALQLIANAQCYVLSSNFEGMPNTLMEAMAIGLPCVSTDCPNGPSELLVNGENGLLVPMNDVKALSQAICTMIENDEFATKCANNAKQILKTNNIESISNQYYDYIVDIARAKRR